MTQDGIFQSAQVLDSGIQIPSPPTLLVELTAALDEPAVSLKKITSLLTRDGGVVAMLFKLAGSPAFGGRKTPESIEQVINLLGLSTVADLVRARMLRTVFTPETPFHTWFWMRADEIARLAAGLATNLRGVARIPPGHAHLAALFLNCGVPVLIERYPDYVEVFQTTGFGFTCNHPRLRELDARFNTNHAVVGHMLAKHWKLPAYVCEAIGLHHDSTITDPRVAMLVALLQAASHIYTLGTQGEDVGWTEVREVALSRLELTNQDLEDLRDEL